MKASIAMSVMVAAALAAGCKKDDSRAADPAPAPAPEEAAPAEVKADTPPPAASDADCKSTKEFTTVDACVALCESGNANACFVAGSSYHVGDKTDENEPKAAEFYAKGCDKGSAEACRWLAGMHRHGDGGLTADEAKAKELEDKARALFGAMCDANEATGCAQLAGLVEDPARSKELYKKACDLGNTGACDKAK